MDFLKSCGTGVQTLNGYTSLNYHIYTLQRPPQSDNVTEDDYLDVEYVVREKKHIVLANWSRRELWLFETTSQGDFAPGLPDFSSVRLPEGLSVERIFNGSLESSKFLSCTGRPWSMNPTAQRSQQSATRQIGPGGQILDTSALLYEPSRIYSTFTSALRATIAFRLARLGSIIPLGRRTYAVVSSKLHEVNSGRICYCVNIDVYLTTAGTLVISAKPCPDASSVLIVDTAAARSKIRAEHQLILGTTTRLARLAAPLDSHDIGFASENAIQWRHLVIKRLAKCGIDLAHIHNDPSSWALVHFNSSTLRSPSNLDGSSMILWPISLCFFQNQRSILNFQQTLDPFTWCRKPSDNGFLDPLQFAYDWIAGKSERDQIIAQREQKRREAKSHKASSAPSPLQSRHAACNDIQAASGVYPTPPDGIASHLGLSSQGDGAGGLAPGLQNQKQSTDSKLLNPGVIEKTTDSTKASVTETNLGLGNDLVDNESEDEFVNDITDADFNFFDEPDVPDVEDVTSGADRDDQAIASPDVKPDAELAANEEVKASPTVNGTADYTNVLEEEPEEMKLEPLDPEAVKKRLFCDGDMDTVHPSQRRPSLFEPMHFNPNMERIDAKYHSYGQFSFDIPSDLKKIRTGESILLPPKERKRSIEKSEKGIKRAKLAHWDFESSESGSSDGSVTEIENLVRSPPNEVEAEFPMSLDSPITSPGVMQKQIDVSLSVLPSMNEIFSGQCLSTNLFSSRPFAQKILGTLQPTDKNFIDIAQLIAEQISYSTLDYLYHFDDTVGHVEEHDQKSLSRFQTAVMNALQGTTGCDLVKFLTVADAPNDTKAAKPSRPVPPRQTSAAGEGSNIGANLLHPVQPPYLRIRRNEALWDVLPPALSFWEPLGLAPTSGPKNLVAYVIYPSSEYLRAQTNIFIDNLGAMYESCKLGTHYRANPILGNDAGLVALDLSTATSLTDVALATRNLCVQLGKALARTQQHRKPELSNLRPDEFGTEENLILYIVDPFDSRTAIPHICSAFWSLWESYQRTPRSPTQHRPDIALQILPIRAIASPGTLVIHPAPTLQALAREVYNRCPPALSHTDSTGENLSIYAASSIQLADTLPRTIFFKLTADPPSNLLHENSHMHIGYTISHSGRWLTASWIDSTGKHHATASYSLLGTRTFAEIAREIWLATVDIVAARRVNWRVCIARVGAFERDEVETWTALIAQIPSPVQVYIILISVDLSPPLALIPKYPSPATPPPPVTPTTTTASASQPRSAGATPAGTTASPGTALTPTGTPAAESFGGAGAGGTPGSTTNAATITNFGTSSGPSGSGNTAIDAPPPDPDAILVDTTDDIWTALLPHRINIAKPNPANSADSPLRLSLSSALLIRTPAPAAAWDFGARDRKGEGRAAASSKPALIAIHLVALASSARGNMGGMATPGGSAGGPNTGSGAAAEGMPGTPLSAGSASGGGAGGAWPNIVGGSSAGSGSVPTTPGSGGANIAVGMSPGVVPGPGPGAGASTSAAMVPKASADGVLREYAGMFRALAVLARARGVGIGNALEGVGVGGGRTRAEVDGLVPWHLVVCVRSVEGLDGLI